MGTKSFVIPHTTNNALCGPPAEKFMSIMTLLNLESGALPTNSLRVARCSRSSVVIGSITRRHLRCNHSVDTHVMDYRKSLFDSLTREEATGAHG